jgi:hypothetical protein
MKADSPIVDEVRRRRCELSERFDNDLRKYGEHLREIQTAFQSRVVDQVTVVRSHTTADTNGSRS